jgi:hypothetical protein
MLAGSTRSAANRDARFMEPSFDVVMCRLSLTGPQ